MATCRTHYHCEWTRTEGARASTLTTGLSNHGRGRMTCDGAERPGPGRKDFAAGPIMFPDWESALTLAFNFSCLHNHLTIDAY